MRALHRAALFMACAFALLSFAASAFATTESTLYTFSPFNQSSQLIQAHDGNFYATTSSGGLGAGFVYRLTPAGTITIIHSFNDTSDGGAPTDALIEGNDGNLYGTTPTGGLGYGTLFRMSLSGSITILHNFVANDGTTAGAIIMNNAGDIFGASMQGGSASDGTVYEYSHAGVFSVVHTFNGVSGDGVFPTSELLQASDGYIYGATRRGGSLSNGGSLFRFNPLVAGSFSTFASFPPTLMSDPYYNPTFGMTQGADGALYGFTAEGGTFGYGTVYKVVPGTSPVTSLNYANFNGGSLGGMPDSSLTLAGDHNFYGTTSAYGPGGPPNGTIFQFGTAGTLGTVYPFSSPHGQATGAPLEAADGNFYGPASGEIYKLQLTSPITKPVNVAASASSITIGSSFTLTWNVTNAYSQTARNCWAHDNWSGSKAVSGTTVVTPAAVGSYTYSLTCGGVESGKTSVLVNPVPTPTPTPVISPAAGTYTAPIEFNITDSVAGAIIHYTLDGTTPTLASPVWAGTPFVLVTSATVKAVAIHAPSLISAVASSHFTISPTTATACTINFTGGFASPTGLVLNHGASIVGSTLDMTHNLTNESTSAFTKARIPLKIFATDFRFQFLNATSKSGDGLTFAINAKSPTLYGRSGAGLGYTGIPNSMAVKFDLKSDAGEGANSVGLYFNGTTPSVPAVDLTPSGIDLHSGHIMEAYISYDGVYVKLTLTDTVTSTKFTHTFTVPSPNPIGATLAYAGFTASTDLSVSDTRVLTWGLLSAGACQ